jgi:hypothetical protein
MAVAAEGQTDTFRSGSGQSPAGPLGLSECRSGILVRHRTLIPVECTTEGCDREAMPGWTRICRRCYGRAWSAAHGDYFARWRAEHPDRVRDYRRRYNAKRRADRARPREE